MKTTTSRRLIVLTVVYVGVFLATTTVGSLSYFHFADPGQTCVSCHEMTTVHSNWALSSHRTLHCRNCHGGSLTLDAHALTSHARRVVQHFTGEPDRPVRVKERDVIALHQSCQRCHPQAYADWQASRHSTTFARIFLDGRNRVDPPADDCLRCHGQFVDGDIATVVARAGGGAVRQPATERASGNDGGLKHRPTPDTHPEPTWALVDPARANQPAIPCLSCHEVHAPAAGAQIASVYSRREKTHIGAAILPVVQIRDGDRPVRVSRDPRQRVCAQCHTPNAAHQLGSADDRTPAGVHEGLSCRDCHTSHNNSAQNSCKSCHPADSHCGIDVEKMDTTFRSPESRHNIHRVACADCHPGGVPTRTIKVAQTE